MMKPSLNHIERSESYIEPDLRSQLISKALAQFTDHMEGARSSYLSGVIGTGKYASETPPQTHLALATTVFVALNALLIGSGIKFPFEELSRIKELSQRFFRTASRGEADKYSGEIIDIQRKLPSSEIKSFADALKTKSSDRPANNPIEKGNLPVGHRENT